jgi:hypothetical protein
MTEREAYLIAFGPRPDPESDGAGRDCYAELMRNIRDDRRPTPPTPSQNRSEPQ